MLELLKLNEHSQILRLVLPSARTRPNKVAVKEVSTGRETTYGQLEERSCRLASWLQNKGVKKGDRVAILVHNCTEVFGLGSLAQK